MKEKLYKFGKSFVEKEARIKMPTFEKFNYVEFYKEEVDPKVLLSCLENSGKCSECNNKICCNKTITIQKLFYIDNQKLILIYKDYTDNKTIIQVKKFKKDYSIVFEKSCFI